MKKLFLLLFFFGFIFSTLQVKAQNQLNPVKWEYSFVRLTATEGTIIIRAVIEDKWHIYSQLQPDEGPIATSFKFTSSANYELKGKTEEPKVEKAYSEVFGTDVISFTKEAIFSQHIIIKSNTPFTLSGEVEFMACNDNMCLPPKTLTFNVNIP